MWFEIIYVEFCRSGIFGRTLLIPARRTYFYRNDKRYKRRKVYEKGDRRESDRCGRCADDVSEFCAVNGTGGKRKSSGGGTLRRYLKPKNGQRKVLPRKVRRQRKSKPRKPKGSMRKNRRKALQKAIHRKKKASLRKSRRKLRTKQKTPKHLLLTKATSRKKKNSLHRKQLP